MFRSSPHVPIPRSESCRKGPWSAWHRPQTDGVSTSEKAKREQSYLQKSKSCNKTCTISLALSKGQKPTRKPESTTPLPTKSANWSNLAFGFKNITYIMPSKGSLSFAAKLPLQMLLSWPGGSLPRSDRTTSQNSTRWTQSAPSVPRNDWTGRKAHLPILRILILLLVPLGACRKRRDGPVETHTRILGIYRNPLSFV